MYLSLYVEYAWPPHLTTIYDKKTTSRYSTSEIFPNISTDYQESSNIIRNIRIVKSPPLNHKDTTRVIS